MNAEGWLAAAAHAHLGFQATITLLAYPALGDGGAAGGPERVSRHVRRITPLVVIVYGGLAAACVAVLVSGDPSVAALVACGLAGALALVTAVAAGPQHPRLARTWDVATYARLLLADRVRLALAVAIAVAATLGAG